MIHAKSIHDAINIRNTVEPVLRGHPWGIAK